MSKANMNSSQEDSFERQLEGSANTSMDDWEFDLGERILKIEKLLVTVSKAHPVRSMLERKLIAYNSAIKLLETNPKLAASISGKGGLKDLINYVVKAAIEDETREELSGIIRDIRPTLPGARITQQMNYAAIYSRNKAENDLAIAARASVS